MPAAVTASPSASPTATAPAASPAAAASVSPQPSPSVSDRPQVVASPVPWILPENGFCCERTTLHGKIVDSAGKALAGAQVKLSSLIVREPLERTTVSDERGEYRIDSLLVGMYLQMRVEKTGYGSHQRIMRPFYSLTKLDDLDRIDVTLLSETATQTGICDSTCIVSNNLSGKVYAPESRLDHVRDISLKLTSLDPAISYTATTRVDEKFNYAFTDAPAATRLELSINWAGLVPFRQELVLKPKRWGEEHFDVMLISTASVAPASRP